VTPRRVHGPDAPFADRRRPCPAEAARPLFPQSERGGLTGTPVLRHRSASTRGCALRSPSFGSELISQDCRCIPARDLSAAVGWGQRMISCNWRRPLSVSLSGPGIGHEGRAEIVGRAPAFALPRAPATAWRRPAPRGLQGSWRLLNQPAPRGAGRVVLLAICGAPVARRSSPAFVPVAGAIRSTEPATFLAGEELLTRKAVRLLGSAYARPRPGGCEAPESVGVLAGGSAGTRRGTSPT
jgi:hypothetical protein